jgi:hypothetical protein
MGRVGDKDSDQNNKKIQVIGRIVNDYAALAQCETSSPTPLLSLRLGYMMTAPELLVFPVMDPEVLVFVKRY